MADAERTKSRTLCSIDAGTDAPSTAGLFKRGILRLFWVLQLVARGFKEDALAVHAGALTFASLVSLVPLLTLGFAILKGFGGGEEASQRVTELVSGMPAQFRAFVAEMLDIVLRANFRTLGWAGVAILFVTVVQVLSSIEASFNRIWGVKQSRSLWRKFTNYVSVTVAVPVLIMTAFALSASFKTQAVAARLAETGRLWSVLLAITPMAAAWIALFMLFIFMPNTNVPRRPAAAAALLTALLWLGWQRLYISMQVALSQYDAVYGTFASIPIFLLWLFVSWMIILLGAEMAFAIQHHATYHIERIAARAGPRTRWTIALLMTLTAARALKGEGPPLALDAFAEAHRVPVRLLNDIARQLILGGLLAERADAPGTLLLARDPSTVRVADIFRLLADDEPAQDAPRIRLPADDPAAEVAKAIDEAIAQGPGSITLTELIPHRSEP